MTQTEINNIYNKLQGLDSSEISDILRKELFSEYHVLGMMAPSEMEIEKRILKSEHKIEENISKCKKVIANPSISTKIKTLLKNNPKYVNCTLEIIQLVAPAVAQIYGGLSALTIVGTLTIMCKQGIQNYLS
ncbi:MAG: hypothetical protein J6Y11_00550 [Paludibacteraceae bacterium]|nr:hypothetical protein [Paludibacteraceae bacterium]